MPSRLGKRKDYDLVDDSYDTRIPLHNDEAFQHGIRFKAKYIGTLDVPRPTGRMEIVVAMRRIRYEFKAKAMKKRKVNISVSAEGLRVTLRKKKKKKEWAWDMERLLIMHDPIYRIFYVSHDSHDLKIWSYIARDGSSNVFRCNVFKSPKKSQAMRIVRTVGQAFEVCHKLNIGPPSTKNEDGDKILVDDKTTDGKEKSNKNNDQISPDEADGQQEIMEVASDAKSAITDIETIQTNKSLTDTKLGELSIPALKQSPSEPISALRELDSKSPLSLHHCMQLVQQQLHQAEQETLIAVAQVHLLKDQLSAETTARIESQARNHQLLLQNRDLIEQMNKLVAKLAEFEGKSIVNSQSDMTSANLSSNTNWDQSYSLGVSKIFVDSTTPSCGSVSVPAFTDFDMTKDSPFMDTSLFENTNTSVHTPEFMNRMQRGASNMNGQHTATDTTSTSTVTKSSPGSGPLNSHAKNKSVENRLNASLISSESSSDEDDDIGKVIHLANESGTLKNRAMNEYVSVKKNEKTFNQSCNTSIWTSGNVTPDRLPTGVSYQQSMTFDDTTLSLTVNDSNISNGYTLSPIFDVGGSTDGTPKSAFHHYSLSDPDTPLGLYPLPPNDQKQSIRKSESAHVAMESKGKSMPVTSYSSSELAKSQLSDNNNLVRWLKPTNELNSMEDSFQSEKRTSLHFDQTPDHISTPRIDPPPRVRRNPSTRGKPEFRPRPDKQECGNDGMEQENVTAARAGSAAIPKSASHTELINVSDQEHEIPLKQARYAVKGMKPSRSAFDYGNLPVSSRFDPILNKSKSLEYSTSATEATAQSTSTSRGFHQQLSPVEDISPISPMQTESSIQLTPKTSRKPVAAVERADGVLSKSHSFSERTSRFLGLFSSASQYEAQLKYEPLRKQQASEWHQTSAENVGEAEVRSLNSSYHAGDQPCGILHTLSEKGLSQAKISIYETFSDLSTSLESKNKTSLSVSNSTNFGKTVASFNTNNNSVVSLRDDRLIDKSHRKPESQNLVSLATDSGNSAKEVSINAYTEPASVDGNISLLDDLFLYEPCDQESSVSELLCTLKNDDCGSSVENLKPYAQLLSSLTQSAEAMARDFDITKISCGEKDNPLDHAVGDEDMSNISMLSSSSIPIQLNSISSNDQTTGSE